MKILSLIAVALTAVTVSLPAAANPALDERAADQLVRKSKCLTCHAMDRQKDGPSFKEISAKYKDDPEGVDKLTTHVTVPTTIEIEGNKEEHGTIKSNDDAEILNVVHWLLTR